jgi:hypothetical protein
MKKDVICLEFSAYLLVIVKASSGPRYVVGCRNRVDKTKLVSGTRVTLDMTTLTIMRILPREVDPVVFHMLAEDPGDIKYSAVGGLSDQIRELREVIHYWSIIMQRLLNFLSRILNYLHELVLAHQKEFCCTDLLEPERLFLPELLHLILTPTF